ncbi:rhodanese-like domain-containing protein [Gordonia sp. X0973]|uniref:rhodanese-like domain-containing protein n=1 Tax=Gordonia sp. X0973 TaxID=2742602 RepID=UPI000F53386F|nr:rhodanese-like domain-containing protein [Gordonia sp. X0973]QKT08537.1 rhodanese-like domain-containing protein [Gordonia sp. X0973]
MTTATLAPVSSSATTLPAAPIQAPALDTALSVPARDFRAALDAGLRAVDIRTQAQRSADGAVHGALALDPLDALERLTPGTASALRAASADARWLLISDDGDDAEWLAWHLRARGVAGAVFLAGGHDALRRRGLNGPLSVGELAMVADHPQ